MVELDPELKKQLTELLIALLKNAQDAGAWAKAEIPQLIREKIAYGRALESAEWGVSVTLFLIGILAAITFFRSIDFDNNKAKGHDVKALVIGIPTFVLGAISLAVNTPTFLQVWFAPRLYIVDWLVTLLKTVKG